MAQEGWRELRPRAVPLQPGTLCSACALPPQPGTLYSEPFLQYSLTNFPLVWMMSSSCTFSYMVCQWAPIPCTCMLSSKHFVEEVTVQGGLWPLAFKAWLCHHGGFVKGSHSHRDSSASYKNTRHAGFLAPDSSFLNQSIGTIFWQDKPLAISASGKLWMDLFAQG